MSDLTPFLIATAAVTGLVVIASAASTAVLQEWLSNPLEGSRRLSAARGRTRFSAPVAGWVILNRVRRTLRLGPWCPWGLQVGGPRDDTLLFIVRRGRAGDLLLRYRIRTRSTSDGCSGEGAAIAWHPAGPEAVDADEIALIHTHLRAAVEGVGGTHV
ncbi:MAG: hypothetical protein ACK5LS_00945 [Propioniciclava sp.]